MRVPWIKNLYKEVVISEEVKAEFKDFLPEWIKILQVQNKQKQSEIEKILDKGEANDTLNSLIRNGFRLSNDLLIKLINQYGKK